MFAQLAKAGTGLLHSLAGLVPWDGRGAWPARRRAPRRFSCFYLMYPLRGADGRIADCTVIDCNEQAASLYGKTKAEVIGSGLSCYYHRQQFRVLMDVYELALQLGVYEDEVQLPSAGSVYVEWAARRFERRGACIAVTLRDVGPERCQANELSRLAYHDSLTGRPNRAWLMESLPRIVEAAGSGEVWMALVDLDRFSDLNEELGLSAGDAVLRWLAVRLAHYLPDGSTVVRFGADEFAVVLRAGDGADAFTRFQAALQRALYGEPCPHAPGVSAAIGLSRYPGRATSAEALVAHAELALQAAKQLGKGAVVEYGPLLSSRQQLGRDLEEALQPRCDALYLDYQPRVSVRTGELVGMEALARWRHPQRGPVPPAEFIPLAEQRQLIVALGRRMFDLACRQLAAWRLAGLPLVPVSVNVSPYQLQYAALGDELLACMARHRIAPELIELEITESAMLGEQAVVLGQLKRLRAAGLRLAMDDFGVGYSSLSQLKNLQMDVLKIDRAFTMDLSTSGHGPVFCDAIIRMAHALGMRVVAEGVETEEQLALLRGLRCDEAQGYLLSRPVSPAQMAQHLQAQRGHTPAAPPRLRDAPANAASRGRSRTRAGTTAPSGTPGSR